MNNYEKQYFDLLRDILSNGTKKSDRTGIGTLSVFGRQMRFKMSDGFPLCTTKKIYTKAVFYELLWFLKGGDNIKYLADNDVRIWNEWPHKKYNTENPDAQLTMDEFVERIKTDDTFAKMWGDLGPVYGKQWVDWKSAGIDGVELSTNQIDLLIKDLKKNPDSRRIMVTAWNPGDLSKQLLPPCHYGFQVWTKELTAEEREAWYDKNGSHGTGAIKLVAHIKYSSNDVQHDKVVNSHIHEFMDREGVPSRSVSLMFNMRSVDCFLGMPFDIASYATLLHMIAQCTDMVADELLINTGDTHVYLNHLEQINIQLSRSMYGLPILHLAKNVKNIYDFDFGDISVENYQAHPSIKAEVAV